METRPLGYLAKSIVEMSPIRIHLVDDGFSKARLQIHHQSFEEQAAAFSKGGWYGWCRQGKAVQIPFPLRRSWVVAMPCSFDNIGILGVWCLFAWVFCRNAEGSRSSQCSQSEDETASADVEREERRMRDVTRDEIATDVALIGQYKPLTGREKGCLYSATALPKDSENIEYLYLYLCALQLLVLFFSFFWGDSFAQYLLLSHPLHQTKGLLSLVSVDD